MRTRRRPNRLVLMECGVLERIGLHTATSFTYCLLNRLVLMERRIVLRIGLYAATSFTYKAPFYYTELPFG